MALDAKQQEFVKNYAELAADAAKQLNVSAYLPLAQWALESGWGTADYVASTHNLGGIMKSPKMVASFVSFNQFVDAYVTSMRNDCPVIKSGHATPEMSAAQVFDGTDYNTVDPTYASTIQEIMDELEAAHAEASPVESHQSASTSPNPTAESEGLQHVEDLLNAALSAVKALRG